MKADLSRNTFDPASHYSAVRLQQGRIVTDADWNEQADLTRYRTERQARDTVGPCGGPMDGAGFGLVAETNAIAVYAVDANVAWVAAEDGALLRTTNAAATWTLVDLQTIEHPRALQQVGGVGWLVGDAGLVRKTSDQGVSWTAQDAGTLQALNGLAVFDANRAWAVGNGGIVVATTDGGANWRLVQTPAAQLEAVHFINPFAGLAVGQGGAIIATRDGGDTWTGVTSGTRAHLSALAVFGTTLAWAAGAGGTILRSPDFGATWLACNTPSTGALYGIGFRDALEGWAVGEDGVVLHSTDGGANWTLEDASTHATLRGLSLFGNEPAWAVGDRSTALRLDVGSPGAVEVGLPAVNLMIEPGRYYVDGMLCELEALASYAHQPDGGAAERLAPGVYLIYLDAWQRHLSFLEAPAIREVALGGPDTATRARIMAQVRALTVPRTSPFHWHCGSDLASWDALVNPPRARLSARAEPQLAAASLCEIAATAGYRRLENQLYRVEVHEGGSNPSFKWSRENGSVAYAVLGLNVDTVQQQTVVRVAARGRDANLDLAAHDRVELVDDDAERINGAGVLLEYLKDGDDELELVLAGVPTGILGQDPARHPVLRRWDHKPTVAGTHALPIVEGAWTDLEDGVQVRFAPGGAYRAGDYWQIPARTITGDVEWPRDEHQEPSAIPPAGIEHRYCRLGIVEVLPDGTIELLSDCRELFPPLTAFTQLLYQSGDGQDGVPGQELPQLLRVRVVRGEHPIANATVRFEVQTGQGTLVGAALGSPLDVLTQADGSAECAWVLDADPSASARYQRVAATLLDTAEDVVPGQRVIFCATATITLQYASGDGQQAAAGQPLTHPLEVRVCNGQRPVPGAVVHFTIIQGGGALLDATPVTTAANGVATMRWRLGSSGAQRVEAELKHGGTRVQHVGFNADIEAPATVGPGGCSITIGENGEIKQLTSEAMQELLGQFAGRLCLCFLAGDHVIEGLAINGEGEARVSIHGCGPAAVITLQGRNDIVGFEYFELSDVAINAEERAGFTFDKCTEVVLRNLTVTGELAGEEGQDRPLLHFATVREVTIEGCSIRTPLPGLSVIIEAPGGRTTLVNNDIQAVTSFYGMPAIGQTVNNDAILARMRDPDIQLEPASGEVVLANNRFGLLTLGRDKMNELNEFIAGSNRLTGLFAAATLSGNSIARPESIFISMLLSLGTTLLLIKAPEEGGVVSTFVADSAAVAGTATLLPINPHIRLIVATKPNQCREAANLVVVHHN